MSAFPIIEKSGNVAVDQLREFAAIARGRVEQHNKSAGYHETQAAESRRLAEKAQADAEQLDASAEILASK